MHRINYIKNSFKIYNKLLKFQSRKLAISAQPNIVNGANGEKIIKSPFGSFECPEISISEYMLENMKNYDNLVATECGITGRKYTYEKLKDYSNYVARSLLDLKLQPGSVVALILPNVPEFPIAFLGCLEAGIIVTTINPAYTAHEISRQLSLAKAVAIITSADVAETASSAVKMTPQKLPLIVINGYTKGIPDGAIPFTDLIEKGKSLPQLPQKNWSPDDLAVLPFSSGTTGLSKGVMLTHKNIISNIEMMKKSVVKTAYTESTETNQDIIPALIPFFHIYGLSVIMLGRLLLGNKLITLPKLIPESFIKVLENNKVTVLFAAPPLILFLSGTDYIREKHLQHVYYVLSAAAPIAENDVKIFCEKFDPPRKRIQFSQGYGMTESSPVTHIENSSVKFASIGKPISGCDARIVDPITKKDVSSPGETGELWVRGPHVMKGYLNDEKATSETIQDGWLLTGDISYYDDSYDFYITDRLKELIKVKGFQVAPAELEALLRSHPNIMEAGVIGVPHERYGEVPKAFLVTKNNQIVPEKEIHEFLKGKVSEFKELRGGVQFIDSIPKNPSGKILRNQLKNQYCN